MRTVLSNYEILSEEKESLRQINNKIQYYVEDRTKFLENEIISWDFGINYRLDIKEREKYRCFLKYVTYMSYDIISFLKLDEFFNIKALTMHDYWKAKNKILQNDDDFVIYLIRNAYSACPLFTLPNKESLQKFSKKLYNELQPKIECAKNKLQIKEEIKKQILPIKKHFLGTFGKYETVCFNIIEEKLNIKIERHVKVKQKIIDGYMRNLKLFIEFNEPFHYLPDGSLEKDDTERMKEILSIHSDHSFYIIKRDDFLKDVKTVITNFKNHIETKESELLMKTG